MLSAEQDMRKLRERHEGCDAAATRELIRRGALVYRCGNPGWAHAYVEGAGDCPRCGSAWQLWEAGSPDRAMTEAEAQDVIDAVLSEATEGAGPGLADLNRFIRSVMLAHGVDSGCEAIPGGGNCPECLMLKVALLHSQRLAARSGGPVDGR